MLEKIVREIRNPKADIQERIVTNIKTYVEDNIDENKKNLNKFCLFKILVSTYLARLVNINET